MSRFRDAACAGAPDPADAERLLERVLRAADDAAIATHAWSSEAIAVLALACQRAPYLAVLLARDPHRLERVASDRYLRREKPKHALEQQLAERLITLAGDDDEGLVRRLRQLRGDEMVRLGVRELGLGNRVEVGRELANLAEVAFDAAIGFHDAQLRARFGPPRCTDESGERDAELVVIGMGKLGGQELNFASDVDVIYVYTSDNGAAGTLTLHEYFSKLGTRITAALADVTADDVVFRVDLRLRPEGSRGAIANSLAQLESYYESWGRPWERQAWLKARPCAGSSALGQEVLEVLRPFVYPRITSPAVVDDVMDLNRRIKAELDSAGVESGLDLKNGVGGIREIEFFVQALQLIHAGRQPALRSRTTLVALDQLLFAGLITDEEHRELSDAYRYLRHAEHVLQLESGRQTQRLPTTAEALTRFARRLGHADAAALRQALEHHTGCVARLFATLGAPEAGPPPAIYALLGGDRGADHERELLAELGFRDPQAAQRDLERARRTPYSPFGAGATGAPARVAPELLAELCTSPDPDQALRFTSELVSRRGAWSSIWRLLDGSPPLVRLVASLFGTSQFLAKAFVIHPELIDSLVQVGRASATRHVQDLEEQLEIRLHEVERGDVEERWNRLAEFKQAEILRIGLGDVAGELSAEAVSTELSKLAEVTLRRAYRFVEDALQERHGTPRAPNGREAVMAILALGKLGGRELGYASDLDLVFVYSDDGESDGARALDNVSYFTRIAQRLMGGLHTMHPHGRLYEIDTRLRPSGSQGLLVSSLSAWHKYHADQARMWERQALTKLRAVAGDPILGDEVVGAARQFVYGAPPGVAGRVDRATIAAEVSGMRARIERELGGGDDVKTGRGGLVDIEFASQFLQLVFGHDHLELQTTSTIEALRSAADAGVADPADCALLGDGYRFLRGLEHRMRIVADRSVQRLPAAGPELEKLARRAGYPTGSELASTLARWREEIRAAFSRVMRAGADAGAC